MSGECLFCRIANDELPMHKVYEDGNILAFLDLHPIQPGHCLVIPRQHYAWFEDLPPDLATAIMTCAQRIACQMKKLYNVERVGMFYTGIHVAHAHAHVVPMHHMHDISSQVYMKDGENNFSLPSQLSLEEGERIARQIVAAFQ